MEGAVAVVDDNHVAFLDLDGKDVGVDLGVLAVDLPHVDLDGLTGEDGGSEAALNRLEAGRIVVGKALEDGVCGDAVRAETVEDGLGEADLGGEVGVDVQRVVVTRQTVQDGLIDRGGDHLHCIGLALRGRIADRLGSLGAL